MNLNNLFDLKILINKLNRIATTQALISLNRDYTELNDFTVNNVKSRVETIFNENWLPEKRHKFWQGALNVINRFWGEHFAKADTTGRLSIAFPGIAKLLLDPEMRNAWTAVVFGCIDKSDFGQCRIFETIDHGHRLVVTHEDVDYLVSPVGIEVVNEHTELGSEITADFFNGPVFHQYIGAETYTEGAVATDNYYYRAMAVCVGLTEELDAPDVNYEKPATGLEVQRARCVAMETLLIARGTVSTLGYAAAGLPYASGLLMSINVGDAKPVSNLFVQSVPLDVPNHQFITNHAVSELARNLKLRGIDLTKVPYPELIAVVANLAVQVVQSTEPNSTPIVRFNEPLSLKLVDLIYELERGIKHAAFFAASAKEFKPLLTGAAQILTVVYKNQIRC